MIDLEALKSIISAAFDPSDSGTGFADKIAGKLRDLGQVLTTEQLEGEFKIIERETQTKLSAILETSIRTGLAGSSHYFNALTDVFSGAMSQQVSLLRNCEMPLTDKRTKVNQLKTDYLDRISQELRRRGFTGSAGINEMNRQENEISTLVSDLTQDIDTWHDAGKNGQQMVRSIEEKRALRFKILETLYDLSGGNTLAHVAGSDLSKVLGMEFREYEPEFRYLSEEGLAKFVAFGPILAITHDGIIEVEELRTNPEEETEHFPPMNVVHNYFSGPVGVAQTGPGKIEISDSIVQTANEITGPGSEKFLEVISQLTTAIQKEQEFAAETQKMLLENVKFIVEQANKPKEERQLRIVKRVLDFLVDTLKISKEIVSQLPHWQEFIYSFFNIPT